MSYAIDATTLRVRFGDRDAVRDVSLHVAYGEIVTLLGPNGAGKTTVVETLLGFRRPDGGTARIHGLDPVRDHADVVARTGALLQRGGVWFPMSPAQVLDLTATYYPQPRDPRELLDLLDLNGCARTPWRRLSGGEQQRTLLALALLGRPRVLVLDEPTTAVDPEGRQVIRATLQSERERGCALLITTHELTEAERLADRVVIMHDGLVRAQGTLEELAGDPVLILDLSQPIDHVALSARLGAAVTPIDATTLRCAIANTPETMAIVTSFVAEQGVTLQGFRSRASLEERYLEIIRQEQS